jgi:methyl-accepting chemotaxis protein
MTDERRQGFVDLQKALEQVQNDMRATQETVKANREQAKDIGLAIQKHERNTAVTSQKVDTVVDSVTRIEHKMDDLSTKVTETAVHGQDTREGLSRTREHVSAMHELVLRHDEQLNTKAKHYAWLVPFAGVAVLVFIGYHIDKEAADATLAAIRGLF